MSEQKRPLTYRDAGVDIDAGNDLVKRIGPIAKRTLRPEVMGGLGGFGALCAFLLAMAASYLKKGALRPLPWRSARRFGGGGFETD